MKRFGLILFVCALFAVMSQTNFAFCQTASTDKAVKAADMTANSDSENAMLKSLQTAYYAETHEHALYLEYGKKADEEGFHQVASMFRAMARAEEIHAANKVALITELGAVPQENSEPLLVGSTKENLEFATASESYEENTMYSAYIAQAKKDKNKAAEQTFVFSQAAEPAHLAIFKQASNDLESYRGENIPFLVCPRCGNVVRNIRGDACPICSNPRDKFETVR